MMHLPANCTQQNNCCRQAAARPRTAAFNRLLPPPSLQPAHRPTHHTLAAPYRQPRAPALQQPQRASQPASQPQAPPHIHPLPSSTPHSPSLGNEGHAHVDGGGDGGAALLDVVLVCSTIRGVAVHVCGICWSSAMYCACLACTHAGHASGQLSEAKQSTMCVTAAVQRHWL
jgi:hypothetical protein